MTIKSVPLAALCPPKGNPRRSLDKTRIQGLADSIKADGVLQNLVVEPAESGKYRVISGRRRFLALNLLKRQGAIDEDYRVPVEIRKDLGEEDALRIATVENVQREPLEPIDEADAFAALLQKGATVEDVAVKAGISVQTVRRRVALAGLCQEVKKAVTKGDIPLSVAEAMTLGTEEQQKHLLGCIREGAELDRDNVRHMLIGEKPSAAMAIFPLDRYTGVLTSDLFGEEETTFFEDVDQFFVLQETAVEQLAEEHRAKAAWVEVLNVYSVPWWQYRDAEKGEASGVVINLSPSGRVEVKKGLVRHEVRREVAEETKEAPSAPKERSDFSASLVRYVALQKTVAVQATLLEHPRKAKEVAAVQLLLAFGVNGSVRIDLHPFVTAFADMAKTPMAYDVVQAEAHRLLGNLDLANGCDQGLPKLAEGRWKSPLDLYRAVTTLEDSHLDRLIVAVILLSFGQDTDTLQATESHFNQVALDLGVAMRRWWVPDATFLSYLRRDRLEAIARASGATVRMGKLKDYTKKTLVEALAKHFERTADSSAVLSEADQRGRAWLPKIMSFSASEVMATRENI